ncbi:MAG TPA: hypothetical protein VN641_09815 [Urbifossiella sp.]|nr:hypothetical protein [Urbifossiella sp.]
MSDGRDRASASFSYRTAFPWMAIFRLFWTAMDPKKLLVAAVGIVAMSVGWYFLSAIFYFKPPELTSSKYSNSESGPLLYAADLAEWQVMADLAAPSSAGQPATANSPGKLPTPAGRFRAMPWDEYRGPNPFLFIVDLLNAPAALWWDMGKGYFSTVAPVLMEPLAKFLLPIAKIVSPGVSGWTRFYLFLIILWSLAVWGFCGGVITRLAAVQLADKGPISLRQAVRFVANRYLNFFLTPVLPLAMIAAFVVGLFIFGCFALIPFLGDVFLYGLGLPLVILGGAAMAFLLVGLLGYPLMYPALSVEGDSTDAFDTFSRSLNYVYQAPWQYLWLWIVTVFYGAAVTFFVLFFTSLMVYVGKWAVGLPGGAFDLESRKPEYLFIYAPESFGWKELLLKDSPYELQRIPEMNGAGRRVDVYAPAKPELDAQNRNDFWAYNTLGARMVAIWLGLIFLMMLGFSYSFFWCAATVIYYRLRKKIDEAEPDEVYLEEEEPEAPLAPPKLATGTTPVAPPPPSAMTSLPVISPPVAPPPPVPPPPPIPLADNAPHAPATVPFPNTPNPNGEKTE